MSKIGRMPIPLAGATVRVEGQRVFVEGPKAKFEHDLPSEILVQVDAQEVKLTIKEDTRKNRMNWGLHRALLSNKIVGVSRGFEQKMIINGLGYKAVMAGSKITFSLGYTHKIDLELPKEVSLDIDKSGQQLMFKSADRFILGNVCDKVRSFRPPEPYKGTGIMKEGEVIFRKAGKTKSS